MFENMTEREIYDLLQSDPALRQHVKETITLLDLFRDMTQEQKIRLIDQLSPVYPTIADAFTKIMIMNGDDPARQK